MPTEILDPRSTWPDKDPYDEQAKRMADLFRENFGRSEESSPEAVKSAGPRDPVMAASV